MNRNLDAALYGAMAGAAATLPMSAVMYGAREAGWMGEYPPEVIAETVLDEVGSTHGDRVSYSGWLPALHLMPPPEQDRPGRQPSMVAAHVVYGAVLGALSG